MHLVTLAATGRPGVLLGADVLDLHAAAAVLPDARDLPSTLAAILACGAASLAAIQRVIDAAQGGVADDLCAICALTARADTPLIAPPPRPGILLAHGRAHRDHVREVASTPTQALPAQPIGFLRNANTVVGPHDAITLPRAAPDQVDFEGEIAVVFGRPCHGVSRAEAMAHIGGYTLMNDVSARNWVPQMGVNPDLNCMSKQFASFAPMGLCIATPDKTADLIWSIAELIACYAAWYPFQPGDVLATGKPAGVGYGRDPKVFLKPGDVVSIAAKGIGMLADHVQMHGEFA